MFVPNVVPSSSFSAQGRAGTSLSPQRMVVRQGRQEYSPGMQQQYLQSQQQPLYGMTTTGSPLKFQQQVPTYSSPLPMDASKQFGAPPTLISAATASGEPTQSQPNQAAPGPPRPGRAKRVVSAGKNLQNLIKGQRIGTQQVTTAADWEGEEYITRCLCGLTHDDEFMVGIKCIWTQEIAFS